LGVLRLRQIDDHDVEGGPRGFQKQPPIGHMDVHPRVRAQGQPLAGKILPRQIQNGGVEFHIIHPFQRGVAQSLRDAAVEPSANQQQTARCGMLQQRIVNGLLGGGRVGHVEQNHAVFVNAPAALRSHYGQVSVDRAARGDQLLAAPEALLGDGFEALRPAGKAQQGGPAKQSRHYRVAKPPGRDGQAARRHQVQ
jgi:hypothetical protein